MGAQETLSGVTLALPRDVFQLLVVRAHSVNMGAPMSTFTVSKPQEAFLSEHDFTAVSFWIISIAMIAATVFFYAEAGSVTTHWKTSLHVGGLVTLVAAVHYMYMREYWASVQKSPIVYRYIDWSITVPLRMIEFNPWVGFALGLCGWAFILFEIFAGESAKASGASNVSEAVQQSFNNMRIIVSLGWSIYPAGYFLGQVNDSAGAAQALNVTYNIADF